MRDHHDGDRGGDGSRETWKSGVEEMDGDEGKETWRTESVFVWKHWSEKSRRVQGWEEERRKQPP